IVSDQGGAIVTDPTLVNAWGLAFNPMGAAWISSNGSGISEIYDANGNHVIPSVNIPVPPGAMPPSAPTGQVFNADANSFMGDKFIFVAEDGTISGWQPTFGTEAKLRVDNSGNGSIYKGVALGNGRLFAANFHNASVDTYDTNYGVVTTDGFHDPQL